MKVSPTCDHMHCDSSESMNVYRLKGPELESLLSSFLNHINYDAMTNFFLAYRPYLSPLELLNNLLDKYKSSMRVSAIAGRHRRIRLFVTLRHWISNHYQDDFMPAEEMRSLMVNFFQAITQQPRQDQSTETKIIRTLERMWEANVREFSVLEEGIHGDLSAWHSLLRIRHVTLDMRALCTAQETERNFSQPARLSFSPWNIEHESVKDLKSASFDSIPPQMPRPKDSNSTTSSDCQTSIEHNMHSSLRKYDDHEDSNSTNVSQGHRLKRKPGGNLKKAANVGDLRQRKRRSTMSIDDESVIVTTYTTRPGYEAQTRRCNALLDTGAQIATARSLAQLFKDDNCDESKIDVAQVLQDTIAILEGRVDSPVIISTQFADSSEDTFHNSLDSTSSARILPSRSSKSESSSSYCATLQKSRAIDNLAHLANRTEEASATWKYVKSAAAAIGPYSVASDMMYTDSADDSLEEQNADVTLIEALAIQPLCSVSATGSVPKTNLAVNPSYSAWILHYNEAQLTRCLAMIEQMAFMEIGPKELISRAWISKTSTIVFDWQQVVNSGTHGIPLVLDRANLFGSWIIAEILYTTDNMARADALTKFIDVASVCRDHNNFSTVVQITTALQHPSIKRLRKTWQLLTGDTKRVWARLTSLCDPRSQWRTLRTVQERMLMNPEGSVIPYLGVYLLKMMENVSTTDSVPATMQQDAQIARTLMEMQKRMKPMEDVDRSLVDRLVWIRGISVDEAHLCSVRCEA